MFNSVHCDWFLQPAQFRAQLKTLVYRLAYVD